MTESDFVATTYSTAQRIPGTVIPCYVFESNADVSRHVAQMIANTIRERNSFGQRAVLGLAAGSTMVGLYGELARLGGTAGLSSSGVHGKLGTYESPWRLPETSASLP